MKPSKTATFTAGMLLAIASHSALAETQQTTLLNGQFDASNVMQPTLSTTTLHVVREYAATADATPEPEAAIIAGRQAHFTQASHFQFEYQIDAATGNPVYTGFEGTIALEKHETVLHLPSNFVRDSNVTQGPAIYQIGGLNPDGSPNGSVTWDASSRTLTVGQALPYSNIDSELPADAPATDARGLWRADLGATQGICQGTAILCQPWQTYILSKPDLDKVYLSLSFDESLTHFTGYLISSDAGGYSNGIDSGDLWQRLSFSGEVSPVPAPAATWLFGSALVGLAGAARRKAA